MFYIFVTHLCHSFGSKPFVMKTSQSEQRSSLTINISNNLNHKMDAGAIMELSASSHDLPQLIIMELDVHLPFISEHIESFPPCLLINWDYC